HGQGDGLLQAELALRRHAHPPGGLDVALGVEGSGEDRVVGVVEVAVPVEVQGEVVDEAAGVAEHRPVPVRVGGADADEPDRPVGPTQQLAPLAGALGVRGGAAVAVLPPAVVLVAQAPEAHAVRLGVGPGPAQQNLGQVGGAVGVFQPAQRLVGGAGAQVEVEIRRGAHGTGEGEQLLGSEAVGLHGVPGQVVPGGPLLHRPDAVAPVVAGGEVAAGPAQHGGAQLAHRGEDVGAASLLGAGRVGVEDAAVHGAADVLDELAVDLRVDGAAPALAVDAEAGAGGHRGAPSLAAGAAGPGATAALPGSLSYMLPGF